MKSQEESPLPPQNPVAISRRKLGGEAPIVVNELFDGCLYSGLFGTLDSARIKSAVDLMLTVSGNSEADVIIVDLSNVDIIDTAIAEHLQKVNKTLQMVGMSVVFCGIRPAVAQSMVNGGIAIDTIDVVKNLKTAITEVYRRKGLKVVEIAP